MNIYWMSLLFFERFIYCFGFFQWCGTWSVLLIHLILDKGRKSIFISMLHSIKCQSIDNTSLIKFISSLLFLDFVPDPGLAQLLHLLFQRFSLFRSRPFIGCSISPRHYDTLAFHLGNWWIISYSVMFYPTYCFSFNLLAVGKKIQKLFRVSELSGRPIVARVTCLFVCVTVVRKWKIKILWKVFGRRV